MNFISPGRTGMLLMDFRVDCAELTYTFSPFYEQKKNARGRQAPQVPRGLQPLS